MPGNGHVRFGRRAAETDRQRRRHCAAARPHNLVYDPAVLAAAWDRVRTNTGARTAGVDQITPRSITSARAVSMLADLREAVKAGLFIPDRVRQKSIPKAGGKIRRLGFRRWRTGLCRRR